MNPESQNFNLEEIVCDSRYYDNLTPEESLCAGILIGTLETVRDYLSFHAGKPVALIPTSGLRRSAHNIAVYKDRYSVDEMPVAALTSNHIWRIENNCVRCAIDFKTKGMSLLKAFNLLKPWWTGELYLNNKEQIIHIGYQGKVLKTPWVQ